MSSEVDQKALEAALLAYEQPTMWQSAPSVRLRAAIKAYLRVSASPSIGRVGAPAIKPLEWAHFLDEVDGVVWRASKPFGSSYYVTENDGRWVWLSEAFDTADEAKAAAQADYEARILSTLVYHEEPAGDTRGALPVTDETQWVMVPREPTEAMLNAAMDDLDWWQGPTGVSTSSENAKYDDMSKATIADAYRAMLFAAAPAALVSPPDNGDAVAVKLRSLVHQPNPTDPTRWDVAPGKHKAFSELCAALQSHNEGSTGK